MENQNCKKCFGVLLGDKNKEHVSDLDSGGQLSCPTHNVASLTLNGLLKVQWLSNQFSTFYQFIQYQNALA